MSSQHPAPVPPVTNPVDPADPAKPSRWTTVDETPDYGATFDETEEADAGAAAADEPVEGED